MNIDRRGQLRKLLFHTPEPEFDQAWDDYITLQIATRIISVRDSAELYPGAFRRDEAAAYLGIGARTFDAEVREQLGFKTVNSVRLYPKFELDKWLADTEPAPTARRRRRG